MSRRSEAAEARKRIEEAFGWAKTVAGLAKTKLRGTKRVAHQFTFTMAAYNLIRCRGCSPRREARPPDRAATTLATGKTNLNRGTQQAKKKPGRDPSSTAC